MIQKLKHNKEILAAIVVSILLLIYVLTVLKYTSFMPIEDDYGAVLGFLNGYVEESDILTQLQMLFSQHMEHRIVFNRIIEILQLKLFGEVNFFYLTLFGNLGWLLIVYLLWIYAEKNKFATLFSFMPVALMLLSFSHSSLMSWSMASIQQYWQLLFSLLAIFFLVNHKPYKAYIFMVIAIFTGGGGFALMPIFVLYYLINRHWKQLTVTLLLSILIMYFYFIVLDFNRLSDSMSMLLVTFKYNYMLLFYYILTFLGNFVSTNPLAVYVGGSFIVLFLFKSKTFFKKTPFIAWAILFVLSIAFLAGVSRSMFGPDQALAPRYSIYSVLFASLVYLAYLRIYSHSKILITLGLIVGTFTFVYSAIERIPLFEQRKYIAETTLAHPNKKFAKRNLIQSYKQGIFTKWKGKIKLPSSP